MWDTIQAYHLVINTFFIWWEHLINAEVIVVEFRPTSYPMVPQQWFLNNASAIFLVNEHRGWLRLPGVGLGERGFLWWPCHMYRFSLLFIQFGPNPLFHYMPFPPWAYGSRPMHVKMSVTLLPHSFLECIMKNGGIHQTRETKLGFFLFFSFFKK